MLPRQARLRSGRDFGWVYARSRSLTGPRMILKVRARRPSRAKSVGENPGPLRVGFSISKKTCRKAHVRNRIRRQISEIIRCCVLPKLIQTALLDAVIVVRSEAIGSDFAVLEQEVRHLFDEAGVASR